MAGNGVRRCISMRDSEYIALNLYRDSLDNKGFTVNGEEVPTTTGVLRMILFGDIPPVPKKFLDDGRIMAKEARKSYVKNPKKTEIVEDVIEDRPGGSIFTF